VTELDRSELDAANDAYVLRHPGERSERQPVQSFIEGAQHFRADTIPTLGARALDALERYAADGTALARAMLFGERERAAAADVHDRVARKLRTEPVEDYRIDFEDGYGTHADAIEDAEVKRCAEAAAEAARAGVMPPSFGIRVKPLTRQLSARSLRTTDLFVETMISRLGELPRSFVITLAKVTVTEQVAYFARHLEALERRLSLPDQSLRMEIMVEAPRAVMDWDGRCPLPAYVEAARGHLVAASLGTYDYTTALGVSAAQQRQRHPACEHARLVMQVALAGTGVRVSDGSTAILPSGTEERVHDAWRVHHKDVRHALQLGIYCGWDLHPAQLISRYAAVYAFYLTGLEPASRRLATFLETVARGDALPNGHPRDIADDVATGQALLNFLLRAIACGATDVTTASSLTGLSAAELDGRAFRDILQARLSA
jgi:citrate lyase beta subunit